MSAGRRLLAVADALPVIVLAAIVGAGSFTHIRNTSAQHGQTGPMSWAVAVSIDLTCVIAARERQRDQRLGITTRRLSWPAIVLAGALGLSLAANLAQAQPDAWGRIVAAVPGQDGDTSDLPAPGRPSPIQDEQDETLLATARRAAAEHQDQHSQPITRDALRARLGVSNQAASELLRYLRADEVHPPGASRAA